MQIDYRGLRLWRQVIADLGQLRLNLREGSVGVVVELQVHRDRAEALGTRRLHVVDPVRAGNHALQGRGNEAADQIRVGAHVNRRNLHHRDIAARILTHAERTDGLQPGNQDYQADDNREDWPLDKEVSKFHLAILGLGSRVVFRSNFVIDLNSRAVSQFENSGTHNFISRIHTRNDRDLIAA